MNTATIERPAKMPRRDRRQPKQLPASPESVVQDSPAPKPLHHIVALANVGWGNSVYIRGEGGNLSWDMGAPLYCVGDDRWVYAYPADSPPKAFKFTLNDTHWALGENLHPDGNEILIHIPQFSHHQTGCERKDMENTHGIVAQPI